MTQRRSILAAGLLLPLIGINWYFLSTGEGNSVEPDSKPKPKLIYIPVVIPGPRSEDCGLRCMYLICKVAGLSVDLPRLRELTKTTNSGTSMLALKDAAFQLGFTASPQHLTWKALHTHLAGDGNLAILFCGTNHFVAATAANGDRITLVDTAIAIQEADEQTLSSAIRWSGKALLLKKHNSQEAGN